MSRAGHGWRLIALSALALACSPSNPPFRDDSVAPSEYFPTVLAPGAEIAVYGEGTRNATSSVWPLDGGGFVGALFPRPVFNPGDSAMGDIGMVRAAPDGSVATEKISAFGLVGTSLGNEVFLSACGFTALASVDAPIVRLTDATSPGTTGYNLCQGVYGRGAKPDTVIHASLTLEAIFVQTIDRAARSHLATPLFGKIDTPAPGYVLFVDEPQAGQIAVVFRSEQSLLFIDPSNPGSPVTATGLTGNLGSRPVWRGKDGVLRVATSDALYTWDPTQPAVQKLSGTPASPTGTPWKFTERGGAFAESGHPNPLVSGESTAIPDRMAVLTANDGGFAVFEPPLTPCCDRDACRIGGESYILGGFPTGTATVAFYDLWSWQDCLGCKVSEQTKESDGYHALVAATVPARCANAP